MTQPLRDLRAIILNEKNISSGIILDITGDTALVSTSAGIQEITLATGKVFKVGDEVVIKNNTATTPDTDISGLFSFDV